MRGGVGQHARAAGGKNLLACFVFHGEHGVGHLAAKLLHLDFLVELAGVEDHEVRHVELTSGC